MRTFGLILLLFGIGGTIYCSMQLGEYPPIPAHLSISEAFDLPAGKWQVKQYASAAGAAFGFLMLIFPKGR
jgi:uncharacterized membrane protein YczE